MVAREEGLVGGENENEPIGKVVRAMLETVRGRSQEKRR
ncbi:MAG: hypothetical protein BWX73_02649 [Lentisphaerae bacterium ADurb.Bin082]|nr:MAG: hypothetical protein BWX73_02649 [Lentisphaerae bacterium ADurb.Bin082]